jgi:hypothetical protein
MGHPGDDRLSPTERAESEERGLWRFRACLIISVVVYLGLAGLSALWLPAYPVIAFVLVFFGAHSAAYLLFHEVRGETGGPSPREEEE